MARAVKKCFIDDLEHLVSKTYMTRVEGENSRMRHKERTTTPQDLLLLQVLRDAQVLTPVATALPEVQNYPSACLNHDFIVQRPLAVADWEFQLFPSAAYIPRLFIVKV